MPNWCNNELEIRGNINDLSRIMKKAKITKSALDFNKFIPYPKKFADLDKKAREKPLGTIKNGYNSGGYEWCIKNWGTKWNACGVVTANSIINNILYYSFDTAWSPPFPVILEMSKKFPSLHFTLKYLEIGVGSKGVFEVKNGKIIKDFCKDFNINDEVEVDEKEKVEFT